ncbi:MAG: Holliday junction resolvase RuvX [Planctomycetes bacterium]|nr:Holliday junction resolvase RuvX [Planctomycetota bacterium]
MKRLLGIDYGTKRVGLALGDTDARIAVPVTTITRQGSVERLVASVIETGADYDVDAYVLGIPYNMDDTVGRQAKITQSFGKLLAEASGRTVYECDERLSSLAADEYLEQAELTRKKKKARRDALAAQVILQTFFDSHTEGEE